MVRKKKHKALASANRRPDGDRRPNSPRVSAAEDRQSAGGTIRPTSVEGQQSSSSGASSRNALSPNTCDHNKKHFKNQKGHGTNRFECQASTSRGDRHSEPSTPKLYHETNHHKCSNSTPAPLSTHPHASGRNLNVHHKPYHQNNPRHLQIHPPNSSPNSQYVERYTRDRRRSRGRRAGRQPWRDHSTTSSHSREGTPSSQVVQSSEPRPSSSTSNSSQARDLPGFYFDPTQKKYFRILPGHQSAGPSTVTRESLKLKATEEARQQSLREFALRTIQRDPTYGFGSTKVGGHAHRSAQSRNIVNHVYSLQHGILQQKNSGLRQNKLTVHQLSRFQPACKQKVLAAAMGPGQGKVEHMTRMLPAISNPNSPTTRLVCLWSLKSLLVQRIQLIEVNRVARTDGSAIIDSSPIGAVITPSLSKVTDMCWALKAPEDGTASPVIYTTTCIMGTNPSLAKLRHLDPDMSSNARDSADTEFHLGNKATWSCAWSSHTQKFSVGLEECAFVIDVATRRLWELHTRKSDVLSQTFSNADSNTLYNGTRKGEIVVHDLRSASTRWVSILNHKSSLCHLHMMRSGSHLLASDFSGRLCMWDLRMRRVVQEFKGHNNEYTRIPFMVDTMEHVLCAAGQDCYTRVWDLRSTELLLSIPPPYPASRDFIPAVCVYTSPTGHMDRPGLLMGIKDELHLYTS